MAKRAPQPDTTLKTRVLIVDDNPIFIRAVSAYLHRAKGFEIVGAASRSEEAAALAKKLQPDLILLDLVMPGISGLDAVALIKGQSPESKVIIVTLADNSGGWKVLRNAGADGLVCKAALITDLLPTVHSIMSRER